MVFQNPILLNRTTFENIMYVAKRKNIETNESVDKIIKQLNLESIINIAFWWRKAKSCNCHVHY